MATDTTLKMVDWVEKYAVMLIIDAENAKLISQTEITVDELHKWQATDNMDSDLPKGQKRLLIGKALRTGEATARADGQLIIKTGEALNGLGVMDCVTLMLHPEEWAKPVDTIAIADQTIAAVPPLQQFVATKAA